MQNVSYYHNFTIELNAYCVNLNRILQQILVYEENSRTCSYNGFSDYDTFGNWLLRNFFNGIYWPNRLYIFITSERNILNIWHFYLVDNT